MWWEQVEKRRRERKAREGFKVSILSILFLGSVYLRVRAIASHGSIRFLPSGWHKELEVMISHTGVENT